MNLFRGQGRTVLAGLAGALALAFTAAPADAIIIIDTPPPSVTASPSTGLVDGQTVTFTGSGFPYVQPVIVKQCSRDLAECSAPTVVTTTTNGYFSTETTVAASRRDRAPWIAPPALEHA